MNLNTSFNIRDENSVIAHLLKIDEILKQYHEEIKQAQTILNEVQAYTVDISQMIQDSFKEIETEIQAKIQDVLANMMDNKHKIVRDATCYKNEIEHLLTENGELLKQIDMLKLNIQKMEDQIGHYNSTHYNSSSNYSNNPSSHHSDSNRMTFTEELHI
jgi:phage terminase small subunit